MLSTLIAMSMYLSAVEAAERLGVSRTTLYAYVSRGQVRSQAKPGTRQREYLAADIDAMVQRKRGRADPNRTASEALGVHGLPVLESSVSSIEGGVLRYYGHEVVSLARRASLETVAALVWNGSVPSASVAGEPSRKIAAPLTRAIRTMPLVNAMHMWLAVAGAKDPAAYNLAPDAVRRSGAVILRGLACVAADVTEPGSTVAETLASGWGVRGRASRARIEAALILSADHELNVSAFTARCVASARGTPYMVVTAALAALQGHRHGGETERVAAMLDEPGEAETVLACRLRRGDRIPGFGHPLYPDGDPRGRRLVELAARGRHAARTAAFVEAGQRLLGTGPTLDLGLVTLARSLGLPPHGALALFAVGRSVGWIAHALEQYAVEPLIRPRARYVGPAPVDDLR